MMEDGMDTSRSSSASESSDVCVLRVCIAGAGFAGAILGRQLDRAGISVTVFERAQDVGESETGTGLNLNPNGLASLAAIDPELEKQLRSVGLPRSRMTSTTMSGKTLYSVPICNGDCDDLALNSGLRVRWRDASIVIRQGCSRIQYGKRVISHSIGNPSQRGCISVSVLDLLTGVTSVHSGFDLLVVADGRYSVLRSAVTGEPPATMAGVCNFRLLVQDTSQGKFDDLELIYNDSPSLNSVPPEIASDPDVQHCFNGFPRFGVLKVPPTDTCMQPSVYIFGNFPVRDNVPEAMKRADVLRELFTPSLTPPDAKGQWLLSIIEQHAHRLHWARMQEIPFVMRDTTGRVLLLGDASHAMVPTLGQGATTAIEDACIAASKILGAVSRAEWAGLDVDVPALTAEIESIALPRAKFISDVSQRATEHLRSGMKSLETDMRDWTVEAAASGKPAFRSLMRQVWQGFPNAQQLECSAVSNF